jgi:nitroreductase
MDEGDGSALQKTWGVPELRVDWMRRRGDPATTDSMPAACRRFPLLLFGLPKEKTMNPAIELLSTRRSVPPRLLTAPAPSEGEIETMLTIAARVPDHGRVVPWRFIVIGPEGGARLGNLIADTFAADHPDALPATIDVERARLLRAPLVIAVVSNTREHPKAPEWEQILSAGAAAMSLLIAANALGYAGNWHTEWYAYDRRILDELGLAEHERIAGFIHIGTASEQPADRPRPALAEVVVRYGEEGVLPFEVPFRIA